MASLKAAAPPAATLRIYCREAGCAKGKVIEVVTREQFHDGADVCPACGGARVWHFAADAEDIAYDLLVTGEKTLAQLEEIDLLEEPGAIQVALDAALERGLVVAVEEGRFAATGADALARDAFRQMKSERKLAIAVIYLDPLEGTLSVCDRAGTPYVRRSGRFSVDFAGAVRDRLLALGVKRVGVKRRAVTS